MANQVPRPPFDPAYQIATDLSNPDRTFDVSKLRVAIQSYGMSSSSIEAKHPHYQHTNLQAPGINESSDTPVTLAFYKPSPETPALRSWPNGRPLLYYVHGGGQIAGDRFVGLEFGMDHFRPSDNVAFASPEYRLAPEHPAPAGARDVYAGLVYFVDHAKELGIDPSKIVLYGNSGGAGVVASAALLSRKLGGPKCAALVLNIPMLDDRGPETPAAKQFWDQTIWPGWTDERAWSAILGDGDRSDADGVRVAGRADSLAGLPPTFIDIGECECMRDLAVSFASRIWKDGGSAELHVWPGVYHGAALFESGVPVSEEMTRAQRGFLWRILGLSGQDEHAKGKQAANL